MTCHVPGQSIHLEQGDAAWLNAQILHSTAASDLETEFRIHLFDPALISGMIGSHIGSHIELSYVRPFVLDGGIDLIPIRQNGEKNRAFLIFSRSRLNSMNPVWDSKSISAPYLAACFLRLLP